MTWIIPALLCGILRAFAFDVNRKYKVDGAALNFWRLAMVVPVMLIISLFLPWPEHPYFYSSAVFCGFVVGIGDKYLWRIAASNNSRIASMFDAVNSFASFILWFVVTPAAMFALFEDYLTLAGILISYSLLFAGIWVLRSCKYSWEAFRVLLIVCFFNAINAVIVKYTMDTIGASLASSLVFTAIFYSCALLFSGLDILRTEKALPKFSSDMRKPALYLGSIFSVSSVLIIYALSAAPNPGYAIAVAALSPVWLVFIHKAIKAEDHTKPLPILLILISSVMLVLLTN